jgi:hypothetical protein
MTTSRPLYRGRGQAAENPCRRLGCVMHLFIDTGANTSSVPVVIYALSRALRNIERTIGRVTRWSRAGRRVRVSPVSPEWLQQHDVSSTKHTEG